MRAYAIALCSTLALYQLGCGGGGESRPRPLSYHFDDVHIAAVPMGEKNDIFQAQNDYSVAKAEYQKAVADFESSGTELDVAKNERQQALLAEKSARQRKKAADSSSDMTRINQAAAELRAAELARKAADEKVSYLKAHRKYLQKWVRYTEEEMYAKEARFELAKARLAHNKNIKPKGFDIKRFENQAKDRSERAQRARAKANSEKAKAEEKRKKWQTMLQAARQAGGGSSDTGTGTGTATDPTGGGGVN